MGTNNLRIIYNNLVDLPTTTITAVATIGYPTENLRNDTKSLVWRSISNPSVATFNITFASPTVVNSVIMPFCNLTSTAIGSVSTTLPNTIDNSFGNKLICPYERISIWEWDNNTSGFNSYGYRNDNYARYWFPPTLCDKLYFSISDTALSQSYFEASRLIVGNYWSPKHNTSFGMSSSTKDMGTHQRTQAGNLSTSKSIRYNTMSFDLNWMTSSDRQEFTKIIKNNGISKPLFVSLFPDNSADWNKEQAHQIYGKLSQVSAIQHPVFEHYSTQVELEEI